MPKEIENKIDEDSSAIVKSKGSAIVETPERPLPNLALVDKETEESTSITTEQLQSIRNGLATTVKLTDQIVKIIGDGNKSLNKAAKENSARPPYCFTPAKIRLKLSWPLFIASTC